MHQQLFKTRFTFSARKSSLSEGNFAFCSLLERVARTSLQPAEPQRSVFSHLTTTGITSSFVDSGGNDTNILADVGETIRWEQAILKLYRWFKYVECLT